MSVLTFQEVSQSFGAVDIFAGLSGSIPRGARTGLVGPNGIGKTTLLRALSGLHTPTSGSVHVAKGTQIGYLQQEAVRAFADRENTVYDEMLTVFADLRAQEARLRRLEADMASGGASDVLLGRYGTLQEAFELAGGYEYELRIGQVLTGLGFGEEQYAMPLAHCSGGQKTRALLARLLLEQPDLLILDEPTNHLDVAAVEWLEDTLRAWEGALLVVSHDRYFLDKVCNVTWEMSRNGLEVYRGNYSAYLLQREERWARRDAEYAATIERFLKELDYVKRNIARESTTDQAKGRLRRLVRMVKAVEIAGVQILQKNWLRVTEHVLRSGTKIAKSKWNVAEVERHIKELRNPHPRHHQLKMRLGAAQRGGNIVLRTKELRIGYPGVPLFEAEDIELLRQECAALIGPNGTGKTTFLRTLLSEVTPLSGEARLGANLDVGYFSQAWEALDTNHTVLEEYMAHEGGTLGHARDYLARFLFRGDDVFKPVRALSGGERSRLALALLSPQKANLLLLDEPTNHLDLPSQEALQEALQGFEGTILMVSHDRYLVDVMATQIWDLRDGHLYVHKGGYASYLAMRQEAQERAKETKTRRAVKTRQRRVLQAKTVSREVDVEETEKRIEALEHVLQQLGEDMASASSSHRWEQIRTLGQEYEAVQAQLDTLLAQWEAQSVAHSALPAR